MIRNRATICLILIATCPSLVFATKPCPPHPCRTSSGEFQEFRCREAADWVAVGSIRDVHRDLQGHPLNKDFAEFTFQVEHWEKGKSTETPQVRYKVGWCYNQKEVPKDYSGSFRFFGLEALTPDGKNQFLDFVPVQKMGKKVESASISN